MCFFEVYIEAIEIYIKEKKGMKQINNGFDECYYLTEKGDIYNNKTDNTIKADSKHSFKLKLISGERKKITLKELYLLVYGKWFCIDNIKDLDNEEWKPIERTNDLYMISNKGRVKSLKGYEAIILKENHVNGYSRVDIMQDGSRSSKLVSRLVAAAFLLPPAAIDMQLHHKNGQRSCNEASNLEWLTPQQHREAHKKMKQKEQENNAK